MRIEKESDMIICHIGNKSLSFSDSSFGTLLDEINSPSMPNLVSQICYITLGEAKDFIEELKECIDVGYKVLNETVTKDYDAFVKFEKESEFTFVAKLVFNFNEDPFEYHFNRDQGFELLWFLKDRKKLMAVKAVKEWVGVGLKDAKWLIDHMTDLSRFEFFLRDSFTNTQTTLVDIPQDEDNSNVILFKHDTEGTLDEFVEKIAKEKNIINVVPTSWTNHPMGKYVHEAIVITESKFIAPVG